MPVETNVRRSSAILVSSSKIVSCEIVSSDCRLECVCLQLKEKLNLLLKLYFFNLFLTRPMELESDAEGNSAQVATILLYSYFVYEYNGLSICPLFIS